MTKQLFQKLPRSLAYQNTTLVLLRMTRVAR